MLIIVEIRYISIKISYLYNHENQIITSPEGENTLAGERPLDTVHDTSVGSIQASLLDHLGLVLYQQFDSLDGSGSGLGDGSGDTRQHEVLGESKLLILTHFEGVLSKCH